MLSVVIPSYNDPYLQKTIDSLLTNARAEIEVIPILDGYLPKPPIKRDKRVKPIRFTINRGMRAAINAGLVKARGKFIMKCDSHCIFGPGYDKTLCNCCQEDWLAIPRRYSLDEANWQRDEDRPVRDYHFLTFPGLGAHDWVRDKVETTNPTLIIDDTMTFQGSCWLANRKYFVKRVGFLDDRHQTYTPLGGEQIEVGLKYWLGGGKVKVIKSTWYAHLSKLSKHYRTGIFNRRHKYNRDVTNSRIWIAKHWLNNQEPGMIHPLSWLVEKFWPVPSWPENRLQWIYPE